MDGKNIKCVVWDLDNTLWDGTLLEGDEVKLRSQALAMIKELDQRGILNSIASKNFYEDAWNTLISFGIEKYFVYPEIGMGDKSESIRRISKNLNLALDSFAFIDDQQYELAEVSHNIPQIYCILASSMEEILQDEAFIPRFITEDTSRRREFYQSDIERKKQELAYQGNTLAFFKSLNLRVTIQKAAMDDLKRVEELTIRTHQLNSTGITYDFDQLAAFLNSPSHLLLVTEMEDRFGDYGKIGVTLINKQPADWFIKLHLMSCRVMTRGVGNVVLTDLIRYTSLKNLRLYADFFKTDRNKNMYLAYKLLGFTEETVHGDSVRFLYEPEKAPLPQIPDYVTLKSVLRGEE